MRTITILLIEDNPPDVRLIRETLKDVSNFKSNLISVLTLKEGCEQIQKNNFDIILLDLNLPDSTGQQTFQKVIDCNNEIPVVLITGMEDEKLSLKLIMEGAQDYLTKQSLNPDLLGKSILYSIERQALLRNIKIQNVQIDRIEKERILIAKFPSQNPGPILRVDGNGKLLYINEAGIKLLPDWQLIINEIIPSRLKDIIDPIFIEGTNIEFELAHCEFIYSFYAVPLFEEGYINLYGRDITERKRAEEALRESKAKYQAIFESTGTATFIVKEDATILMANNECYSVTGYTPTSLIGQKWSQYVAPESLQEMLKDYQLRLQNPNLAPKKYEVKLVYKNGEIRDVILDVSMIPGTKQNIVSILDITERKRAEIELILANEAILQSEKNFHRSISESPLGIRIVTVEGKTIYANKAFLDIFEFNCLEEFTSTPAINRYTPESYAQHQEIKEKRENGHEALDYEISIIRENAEIRHLKVSRKEILWNGIKHYQLINIDITEQKKLTIDLIAAKEHAEESDRLKSAFLTNMSHEIRTPMNGILGFAELLKEPHLTREEQQDFIETIQKSGDRLLNTINNIVDISKIESGLMEVDIKESNINEQIEFVYKFFKPAVESKGLQFFFKNSLPSIEAVIMADSVKLYGILTNLVKNAIKFTNEGSIEFGYDMVETQNTASLIRFFVKDTGIGISQKQKKIIFERFRQGSESLNRNYEGSGLGLSISKSYVELLDGKIWVESEEGKGSTFYFTIPYNSVVVEKTEIKNVDSEKDKEVELMKLKILVVEDDEISSSLLTKMLQKISKEVLHALTGVEAVETCRNNPDLDLILMDIRMPVMDGNEATCQIRQFNKDVIIIAQTAYGFSRDKEKSIEAGCNDYISKPINQILLHELIKKHFDK